MICCARFRSDWTTIIHFFSGISELSQGGDCKMNALLPDSPATRRMLCLL
jgi:hypothetical protein